MFDSRETVARLRGILEKEFQPLELAIEDQSHLHKGHRQAGGGGHFSVLLKSARFNGLNPLARQRLVLESVQALMDREVHALSLRCLPA